MTSKHSHSGYHDEKSTKSISDVSSVSHKASSSSVHKSASSSFGGGENRDGGIESSRFGYHSEKTFKSNGDGGSGYYSEKSSKSIGEGVDGSRFGYYSEKSSSSKTSSDGSHKSITDGSRFGYYGKHGSKDESVASASYSKSSSSASHASSKMTNEASSSAMKSSTSSSQKKSYHSKDGESFSTSTKERSYSRKNSSPIDIKKVAVEPAADIDKYAESISEYFVKKDQFKDPFEYFEYLQGKKYQTNSSNSSSTNLSSKTDIENSYSSTSITNLTNISSSIYESKYDSKSEEKNKEESSYSSHLSASKSIGSSSSAMTSSAMSSSALKSSELKSSASSSSAITATVSTSSAFASSASASSNVASSNIASSSLSASYLDKDVSNTNISSKSYSEMSSKVESNIVEKVRDEEIRTKENLKIIKLSSSESETERERESSIYNRQCLFSCSEDHPPKALDIGPDFKKRKPIRLDIDVNNRIEREEKIIKSRTIRHFSSSDSEASETDASSAYYNTYISQYKRDRQLYGQMGTSDLRRRVIKVEVDETGDESNMEYAKHPIATTINSVKYTDSSEIESDSSIKIENHKNISHRSRSNISESTVTSIENVNVSNKVQKVIQRKKEDIALKEEMRVQKTTKEVVEVEDEEEEVLEEEEDEGASSEEQQEETIVNEEHVDTGKVTREVSQIIEQTEESEHQIIQPVQQVTQNLKETVKQAVKKVVKQDKKQVAKQDAKQAVKQESKQVSKQEAKQVISEVKQNAVIESKKEAQANVKKVKVEENININVNEQANIVDHQTVESITVEKAMQKKPCPIHDGVHAHTYAHTHTHAHAHAHAHAHVHMQPVKHIDQQEVHRNQNMAMQQHGQYEKYRHFHSRQNSSSASIQQNISHEAERNSGMFAKPRSTSSTPNMSLSRKDMQISSSASSTGGRKRGKIPRHCLSGEQQGDRPPLRRRNSNPNLILGRSDVTDIYRTRTRSADMSLNRSQSPPQMLRSRSFASEGTRTQGSFGQTDLRSKSTSMIVDQRGRSRSKIQPPNRERSKSTEIASTNIRARNQPQMYDNQQDRRTMQRSRAASVTVARDIETTANTISNSRTMHFKDSDKNFIPKKTNMNAISRQTYDCNMSAPKPPQTMQIPVQSKPFQTEQSWQQNKFNTMPRRKDKPLVSQQQLLEQQQQQQQQSMKTSEMQGQSPQNMHHIQRSMSQQTKTSQQHLQRSPGNYPQSNQQSPHSLQKLVQHTPHSMQRSQQHSMSKHQQQHLQPAYKQGQQAQHGSQQQSQHFQHVSQQSRGSQQLPPHMSQQPHLTAQNSMKQMHGNASRQIRPPSNLNAQQQQLQQQQQMQMRAKQQQMKQTARTTQHAQNGSTKQPRTIMQHSAQQSMQTMQKQPQLYENEHVNPPTKQNMMQSESETKSYKEMGVSLQDHVQSNQYVNVVMKSKEQEGVQNANNMSAASMASSSSNQIAETNRDGDGVTIQQLKNWVKNQEGEHVSDNVRVITKGGVISLVMGDEKDKNKPASIRRAISNLSSSPKGGDQSQFKRSQSVNHSSAKSEDIRKEYMQNIQGRRTQFYSPQPQHSNPHNSQFDPNTLINHGNVYTPRSIRSTGSKYSEGSYGSNLSLRSQGSNFDYSNQSQISAMPDPKETVFYSMTTRYFKPEDNGWIQTVSRSGRADVPIEEDHKRNCIFWNDLHEPDKEDITIHKMMPPDTFVARQEHNSSNSNSNPMQYAEQMVC